MMQDIKKWLQGKKTYLSAALIALVACLGWWFGVIGDAEALSLLGVAGAAAGLGAKSERTAEAILDALGEMQTLQRAHASGQLGSREAVEQFLRKEIARGAAAGFVWPLPGSPKPDGVEPPSILPIPPRPEDAAK
jgi:hypothetical protein